MLPERFTWELGPLKVPFVLRRVYVYKDKTRYAISPNNLEKFKEQGWYPVTFEYEGHLDPSVFYETERPFLLSCTTDNTRVVTNRGFFEPSLVVRPAYAQNTKVPRVELSREKENVKVMLKNIHGEKDLNEALGLLEKALRIIVLLGLSRVEPEDLEGGEVRGEQRDSI